MVRQARPTHPTSRGLWVWIVAVLVVVALAPLPVVNASARSQTAFPGVRLAQVQVGEGETPAAADAEADAEDGDAERDGDLAVYVSPRYGFALEYDTDVWELARDESNDVEDAALFFNGPSFVTLSATDAFGGDPGACLDAWAKGLKSGDGINNFAPLKREDGEPIAAVDAESAHAAFAFVSSDGAEVFDVTCLVLIEAEATLAVVLETYARLYEAQKREAASLLDRLDLPGVERRDDDLPARRDVIREDFEDRDKGVFSTASSDPDKVRYAYEDGEYVIQTLAPDAGVWQVQLNGPYAGVEIAVEARLVGRTNGRFVKVGCRFTRTRSGFEEYSLVVDPDARRVMLYRSDGEDVVVLADEEGLAAINPDEASNRVTLRCAGATIAAAINGKELARVEDDTYAEGAVYLGAGTYSDVRGRVEARFDNLEVAILDDPAPEDKGDRHVADDVADEDGVLIRAAGNQLAANAADAFPNRSEVLGPEVGRG